eukprot:9683685-Lingulodinium_polyedra.AAC.1
MSICRAQWVWQREFRFAHYYYPALGVKPLEWPPVFRGGAISVVVTTIHSEAQRFRNGGAKKG